MIPTVYFVNIGLPENYFLIKVIQISSEVKNMLDPLMDSYTKKNTLKSIAIGSKLKIFGCAKIDVQ
ncbi:hypothetical protein LV84_02300 [Algoriphagus ratkowskyi]|uniref:Uncharacterized protein n=1 Tax=Algoriphagus ratkowskyi TaxID=57028 RepID=A0A2W7R541_9BACT|nr:hypothetical protein LV84_02300 [Algoriphagus ratkowskyi]